MRVLLITPFYAPDLGPSAPLLTMLCEDLVCLGHQVSAIAAVPHYPTGTVSPEFRGRLIQCEERNGVGVTRVWVPSGNRANLYHRLLTFLVYQLLTCFVGLRRPYDVALITNPALETVLPFALAWLRRKPVLFCVWDLYPEVGAHLGVFRHPAVVALVGGLEDFCLHRASAIQVLSEGFVSPLASRAVPASKLVVIPLWLDTDFVRPLARRNPFSSEHGLDDCFVVLYAGNLGLSQGLEHVLTAAELLADHGDVRFVFVGDGAAREHLVAQAAQRRLANVQFLPFQPRARLPEVLATGDVSLVTLRRGASTGSLPSKSFSILASGRPMLASVDEGSDTWNLVKRAEAGLCLPPENPSRLAQAILTLKRDEVLRKRLGRNGRIWAERYHSPQSAAEQFEKLLLSAAMPQEKS